MITLWLDGCGSFCCSWKASGFLLMKGNAALKVIVLMGHNGTVLYATIQRFLCKQQGGNTQKITLWCWSPRIRTVGFVLAETLAFQRTFVNPVSVPVLKGTFTPSSITITIEIVLKRWCHSFVLFQCCLRLWSKHYLPRSGYNMQICLPWQSKWGHPILKNCSKAKWMAEFTKWWTIVMVIVNCSQCEQS